MRKSEKEKIMSVFDTLYEAHKVIRNYVNQNDFDNAIALMGECQDTAVNLGNVISETESDDSPIIKDLENYCETLYETAQKFGGENTEINVRKTLDNSLSVAEKSAKDNLKVRLKIAFFPYKASMWTSFESIWQSAIESGKCDVRVVPIPYCEFDSDGTPKSWICEADQYPTYVPIIKYTDYDLETEKPDIAFIHNGYDNENTLTSVHPDFYSTNIKKYCGMLVYSPYFTFGSYNPGKSDAFFLNQGSKAANKIIVQSDFTAKIYKKYGYNSNKLIVHGSPKIDVVIKNCSDYDKEKQMPEEWRSKLQGKEKIFLLNTHWSYFLNGFNYKQKGFFDFAQKYHDQFFNAIQNHKDKCGMIWRPHPLLISALEQRAPFLLDYVRDFIKIIEESDFGVVDKNGSYTDAMGCSDALVSTYSSFINEYLVTGKPVLIFQSRQPSEARKRSPIDYGKCYFTFKKDNGITFTQFIEMVLNGEDPMRDERLSTLKEKSFNNMDGTAGKKIFDELLASFN